ncbi:heavy metal translocating P-type ATPase [Chitinimonas arctica]|uniref:Heavy metal translocating P-type ATPase n=1 Tax=Chitinimonas arctica TaxID=2594795 RepID=A0A516SGP8_9NEIS|nr:heavy metal translocating P-type ATPase [Chitinimonas arctica]QDQ27335.1 heavy metal translocating P-type ATPase [Chitinimonas arctica]
MSDPTSPLIAHSLKPQAFRIEGMSCTACAARIEKLLNRQPGVTASVSFAAERATVAGLDDAAVMALVEKAGFRAQPHADGPVIAQEESAWPMWLALAVMLPFMFDMAGMALGFHAWMLPPWLAWALATPAQFLSGWRFYRGSWFALRSGGANMDVLVALGTSAAYGYSSAVAAGVLPGHLYFEASVVVIALVCLGKRLEARARRKTGTALLALAQLQPKTARVVRGDALVELDVDLLRLGDVVAVEAGEAIAADGEVLAGESSVDEALLSGEAMPVDKRVGQSVYAGSLNQTGWLRIRVDKPSVESRLAGIVELVRQAQASKAPIQALADRIAARFVPLVLLLAVLTLLAWWWHADGETALVNAIAVLVIACPCALGLATPTAVITGAGVAAQHGILIRNAAALEAAARLQVLALDKTGTLTEGRPSLRSAEFGADAAWVQALAAGSRHPLSQALAAGLPRDERISLISLRQVLGQGSEASLQHAEGSPVRQLRLGSPAWLQACGVVLPTGLLSDSDNHTLVVAAEGERYLGHASLADATRPDAARLVAWLKAHDIQPVILSGDRLAPVRALAAQLGIEQLHAECLPADKARIIAQLRQDGRRVGMAGDGINDAPALASADLSLAMGQGSEAAIAAADITLSRTDAMVLADALDIARATLRKIRQNLFFAFIYNAIGLPAAALGYLHPAVAGAAMALSSISVLANALTLKRWRPSKRAS